MLSLKEIASFFPPELRRFPQFMLREYLQCKLLEIIYSSRYGSSLCFLGGTCLRLVHGNRRFSEDVDFDNLGLERDEFPALAKLIKKQFQREGYEVEIKVVTRDAWHCYIRFPGVLFQEGLSGYREEKIMIRLDAESQSFDYRPERFILNKFDVFTTILTTPLSLLLSQKLYAIVSRQRKQGRDFFDAVFLMGRGVKPDYDFLRAKLGIGDGVVLKKVILEECSSLDMEKLARDVEPFLFDPKDKQKVIKFADYLRQIKLKMGTP
ncbi:MAG: nucleotidyl transferase AbiEii/AbiGii toxin family protein [Acidobacteriota bacterium]|nr:nucleotidyl transferase AbiEii/AbiGii toxin family protein [Acidobacteriota bacterium]MDW3229747.1 nucleotidyl transferase AbiEii/AbiGii toxin family protein [Acidobacteriota bacterium]